jgi:hypothetical protein
LHVSGCQGDSTPQMRTDFFPIRNLATYLMFQSKTHGIFSFFPSSYLEIRRKRDYPAEKTAESAVGKSG